MATFDQEIDPVTRDYVVVNGQWSETSDSRTAVLCQLEIRLGEDWAAPDLGSRLAEMMGDGIPHSDLEYRDEALRALQLLVDAGVISDLSIDTDKDETGRTLFLIHYWDHAAARPVDIAYAPFGNGGYNGG